MLVFFAILALFNHRDKFFSTRILKGDDDIKNLIDFNCLVKNLNKILNEGLNSTEFLKCLAYGKQKEDYNSFIEKVAGFANITIDHQDSTCISKYFDTNTTLYSLPTISNFLNQNKKFFDESKLIFEELGKNLSQVFNLNYDTINKLYDYILINEENDGVKIRKIFNILNISSEFITKIGQILSYYDAKQPLYVLLEGLNIKSQFDLISSNIKKFKIPEEDKTKFLSFSHILDIISPSIDAYEALYNNFFLYYAKEFAIPIINNYIIKPINIFENPVSNRASYMNQILIAIEGYGKSCELQSNSAECVVFTKFMDLSRSIIEMDDLSDAEFLQMLRDNVAVFTDNEISLAKILIENYQLDESSVQTIFEIMADCTDTNTNYIQLFKKIISLFKSYETSVRKQVKRFSNGDGDYDYSDSKLKLLITNIINYLNVVEFISTVDKSSNFKDLFNYLDLNEFYESLSNTINQINANMPICQSFFKDLFDSNEDDNNEVSDCNNFFVILHKITRIMVSDKTIPYLNDILGQNITYLFDQITLVLQSLDLPLSQFVNLLYKQIVPIINQNNAKNYNNYDGDDQGHIYHYKFPEEVNFTNAISLSSAFLSNFAKTAERLIPFFVKEAPLFGDITNKLLSKAVNFTNLLKNEANLATILDFFVEGLKIVPQMLKSAADAYASNRSMTLADLSKSFRPTTFLDVYETAAKISEKGENGFKSLAESIVFGQKRKVLAEGVQLTLNDVIPYKTVVENSGVLAGCLARGEVLLATVAKALGRSEEDVKSSIRSAAENALSPPAVAIREAASKISNDARKEEIARPKTSSNVGREEDEAPSSGGYSGDPSPSQITPESSSSVPETSSSVPETSSSVPETSPITPETSSSVPETSSSVPETSPITPETSPITPETSPITPETSPITPETSSSVPETSSSVPETSPITPETSSSVPETSPITPETSSSVPESSSSVPESSSSVPETSPSVPETSSSVPETSSSVPETSPITPESSSSEPVESSSVPEASSSEHVESSSSEPVESSSVPEASSSEPVESSSSVPESSPITPETSSSEPVESSSVPETSPITPETSSSEPVESSPSELVESSSSVPETSSSEPLESSSSEPVESSSSEPVESSSSEPLESSSSDLVESSSSEPLESSSSEPLESSSSEPVESSSVPETSSSEPVESSPSELVESSSSEPVESSSVPEASSSEPVESSSEPVESSSVPETSSSEPLESSSSDLVESSSSEPVESSSVPETSSSEPVESSIEPVPPPPLSESSSEPTPLPPSSESPSSLPTPTATEGQNEGAKKLSATEIAAIVLGCFAFVSLAVLLAVYLAMKKMNSKYECISGSNSSTVFSNILTNDF